MKFFIGASVGIPASSLCINRRLYLLQLKSGETAAITMSDRMRALAIDVGISAGLPIIIIILRNVLVISLYDTAHSFEIDTEYIPQGHLFDILEDIGCYPSIYNTWVAVVILGVPPVLVGLISATYAIRAIISINKRRNEFNELLSRHLNVTSGLYFRLMWLAGIEALLTVPIAGFFLIYNAMNVNPWISWENTHFDFDRVDQYPAILWRNSPGANVIEFSRWLYIVCAILFFSFFGFAEEARFHYGLAIKFFLKLIGIRIGHQTETLSFKPGPLDRLEFAAKRSQPDSFSTISTVSSSPDDIHSEKEGERFSPSQESALYQTNLDPTATPLPLFSSPGTALQAVIDRTAQHHIPDLSKSAHHSSVVGQEHERRRSRSISGIIARNLRSFLDLSHDDSSPTNVSVSSSFRADISSIEEGRPS